MFPSYLRGLAAVQYIAVPYMGDELPPSSSQNLPDDMGFKRSFSHLEKRGVVIVSMILQILLFWWTYQRKRTSSRPLRILFLGAFLAADSTAALCLGIVFHANMSTKRSDNPQNKYLLALWAPFMLIHLGRHSRITAFSLGENKFWLGHLIRFIYFEFTALCICYIAWSEQRFHATFILLFIMGTIRYGERVLALKFGSLNALRSFNNFKQEYHSSSVANKKGEISIDMEELIVPRGEVPWTVADVYRCFEVYKGIYTDILFTNRTKEGKDPTKMGTTNAFKFMETELSFAYDLFYTRSVCSDTILGWIAGWISLFSICFALGLFANVNKQGFFTTDVGLTYSLLIIALILELACFVEAIASNRTKVLVGSENTGAARRKLEGGIGRVQSFVEETKTRFLPAPRFSVGQFNLLQFCFNDQKLGPWRKWVYNFFEVKDFLDNWHYTSYSPIEDGEFRSKVIRRVRERLEEENATNLFHTPISSSITLPEGNANFHEFERCLLIWHLSTEVCHIKVPNPSPELQNAKILSDYMIYLLVLHPSLLSPKTISTELTRYQELCAELIVFYSDHEIENVGLQVHGDDDLSNRIMERCSGSLGTNSLLTDGIKLAHELVNMSEINGGDNINNTWEEVFMVWVDMLSFVACWSSGKQHAELLGKGEELITYIRLFMSHFGCQFSVDIPAQESV